ncbi:TetR family transcriptional regulator [Cellulomonas hominis]|jgi:AcrR family transcriptional regulator|uniref:AcrR family transcriptional regulator n=1 Tax=Cellulomonas hominis TaxID=156981 RepID=A0A511FEI8_9CELL|nr:TetR/AcrR family transcriptional regulator [Cellulomonas hominis]MBB5471348.1 AcrR family transcriptional regulator [Cellulomonas hominis]NKY07165.1 TetR/AcrR family transcriptional regulator [Cellulomonas hominis]GEL47656.1 TetR family transcriptional regulator [Cellulomonas hominis]
MRTTDGPAAPDAPAPRTAGPRRTDDARGGGTREAITAATVALIADRGFSATSVDDIAERAGVAKGSVYYNFGSKSALFETVLGEGQRRLTAALRGAVEGRSGREAVGALVHELLEQIHAHPDFAKVLVAEVFRTGRDWQDSIRQVRDESFAVFAEVVAESWPGRDPSLTAAAMFGATLVAGLEWLAFQPERTVAEVRRAVLATLVEPL